MNSTASWSRGDARLIAQAAALTGVLTVFSQDRRFVRQTVRDAGGDPYRVALQWGNRWLDEHRLIFWDLDLGNAFIWDTESETASQIEGISELGEFMFSEDRRTLFRLRTEVDSDIWLLEMPR